MINSKIAKKMKDGRFITAHYGARDNYELSVALNNSNRLDKLITDFYTPNIISLFTDKRRNINLPSAQVSPQLDLFFKKRSGKYRNFELDRMLSQRALRSAIGSNSSLFLYSYYAKYAFESLLKEGRSDLRRFLFQLHPHPISAKKILIEEYVRHSSSKQSLKYEVETSASDSEFDELASEAKLAHFCFVASSYTKSTLIENGIQEDRIAVTPYGVDANLFTPKTTHSVNKIIKLLFVGQIVQRKGIAYMLDALKRFDKHQYELTFVTRSNIDIDLINQYSKSVNFKILKNLSQNELSETMRNNDLLIFPSLIEGFGHVILEAMACGLPVLCTDHTAGPDLYSHLEAGFIVPVKDSEAIASSIDFAMSSRSTLIRMSKSARNIAISFSWQRFRNAVNSCIDDNY